MTPKVPYAYTDSRFYTYRLLKERPDYMEKGLSQSTPEADQDAIRSRTESILSKYENKPKNQAPKEFDYSWAEEQGLGQGTPSNPEDSTEVMTEVQVEEFKKKAVSDSKSSSSRVLAGLLEKITQGVMPWEQNFKEGSQFAGKGIPRNPKSKRIYSGLNALVLKDALKTKGYSDPRWLTFKQAEELGGRVRKGEKGTFILVPIAKKIEDKDTGEESTRRYFVEKAVFNVEQIDGLSLKPASEEALPPVQPLEAQTFVIERYQKAMTARGLKAPKIEYTYVGKYGSHESSPNWKPNADIVTLPNPEQFKSPEDYFEVLMHELTHSTGHETRLNRKKLIDDYGNKDGISRAREELIAEIGSAILADMFGVAYELDKNAAYVGSWLGRLQKNPEEVISATTEAQKAVDYLLGVDLGDWSPLTGYGPGNAVTTPEPKE
jgi:antirestriction protein ArdC